MFNPFTHAQIISLALDTNNQVRSVLGADNVKWFYLVLCLLRKVSIVLLFYDLYPFVLTLNQYNYTIIIRTFQIMGIINRKDILKSRTFLKLKKHVRIVKFILQCLPTMSE